MACRPSRAHRYSSSSLNRGPPTGDTVHRHARGAPGVDLGRLRGPRHAADGPGGARADRAGDRGPVSPPRPAITIARMDFTGVGCIDYSCADEIVAKLLRDQIGRAHV